MKLHASIHSALTNACVYVSWVTVTAKHICYTGPSWSPQSFPSDYFWKIVVWALVALQGYPEQWLFPDTHTPSPHWVSCLDLPYLVIVQGAETSPLRGCLTLGISRHYKEVIYKQGRCPQNLPRMIPCMLWASAAGRSAWKIKQAWITKPIALRRSPSPPSLLCSSDSNNIN